jgi:hypothetical protein
MAAKDQFQYPFEWFDEIVGTELNPGHRHYSQINPNDLATLQQQLRAETGMIWKNLKDENLPAY